MNADSRIVQRNPLLLHFRDESLEEAYIEYLHPQSLMLLTVLYTAVGVGQLLLVAAGLYKVGGLVFTLPISAVLQWGIHLAFKYKKAHPGRLFACVAIIRCGQWQEPRLGTRNSASSDSGGTHSFDSSLTGSSTSGSHQPYVLAAGSATSRSEPSPGTKPSGFKAPFDALETAVAASKFISIASILGDQAVVVGPVRLNRFGARRLATTEAFEEIFMLCTQLPNLASTPNVHFGAIIDVDSVAHIVRSGNVASYSLLGVATTRLAAVADGLGVSGMAGTLLTDRAMKLAEAGVMLNGLEVRPNGPVKVRGAGVVRLLKVAATLPHVELMENVSNASSCL